MSSTGDRIFIGLAYRLFAVFALASMSALIKWAETRGAGLIESMFWRQLLAIPVVLVWLAVGPGIATIHTVRLKAHAIRALVGQVGMIFTFGSVMLLPLAEATTLAFTVPIFATIMGALLLGEKVGRWRWGAVAAGFAGVLIVAQPSGGHFPLWGTIVGLIAALFVALVAILLRQLGRTEGSGTTVFWFSALAVPPLAIAYCFDFRAHDPTTWLILFSLGIVGGIGQLALTAAMRFAPVSVVVPMDYSSLIWATLWGWVIFGVWPVDTTWIGAPIIIASGLVIVWREQRNKRLAAAAEEQNEVIGGHLDRPA